jgi:regulator of replication initiation timing
MSRFKGWIVVFAGALCIWGCTKSSGTNYQAEKAKSLEERLASLVDENKSLTTAREQLRNKLAETEDEKLKIQHDFEELRTTTVRERDDLKSQLAARTTERDSLQVEFESMRKSLHNILNQADAVSAAFSQRSVTNLDRNAQ